MKIIKWMGIILGIIWAIIGLLAIIPVVVVLIRCGFCGLCDNGLLDSSVTILGAITTALLALLTLIQAQKIYQAQDSWTRENTKRPFFIIEKITGNDGMEFRHEGNTYKLNAIREDTSKPEHISKTAPVIEIGGVADRSANNGAVAPVITFTDTNYDANAVTYTLTGVNNGTVTYASGLADIANGQTVTFADFERVQKVDDIYTLTATMTDKAGNEVSKSITFSANRFGSVYDLATITKLMGKYLQSEEDVVFSEINVDSLRRGETKLKLTMNGTPRDLVEGTDYTVAETGGNGLWSQYRYTIRKALFADDGRYSVSVYSVDAAGNINENIDETKKAEISFGIDKTKPVIVPIDFESNTQYPVELKTVSVEIKDNLVLEDVKVYLNDEEIKYSNQGETYTFDIPEKNEKQNVRIVAVDAAGNELEVLVEDFLVSTNVFVRWFNNTPLFIGSIAGVAILCGAIVFLTKSKRKKVEA